MTASIFIDESGDPQFFAYRKRPLWISPDFVPIICLGMVKTIDRSVFRKDILEFQDRLLKDALFNSIYSVRQPGWHLHARADHPDIILKTVEFIRELKGFEFHAGIGRKIPELFINKHNGNATEFYFDLIHKLLELDDLEDPYHYSLFLSQRHSNTEQRFTEAFKKALDTTKRHNNIASFSCSVVRSKDHPEMSIVDYLLWALQRYILKKKKGISRRSNINIVRYSMYMTMMGQDNYTIKRIGLICQKLVLMYKKSTSPKHRAITGNLHRGVVL